MTGDSGKTPKIGHDQSEWPVTLLRNRRSRSIGMSGHVGAEYTEAHHWPIVRSFIDRIDLVNIVNQLVPTQMAVEPGLIVKGLIIDTLSGRSPPVSLGIEL